MNGVNVIVNPTRRYALSASTSASSVTNFYVLKSGATSTSSSILHANTSTDRVGVNTSSPSETLDVNGKTKTINFQMTSGATDGYVLTSDSNGNGTWQKPMGYQYYSAVTITSGQTLSIGSSPVEILPAPGVNKYYDFKVFFEYVFNTTAYSSTGTLVLADNTTKRVTNQFDINGQLTSRVFVSDMNFQNQFTTLNSQIDFTTSDGSNPTLGDGSFKVKIYYNIIDFG